MDNLNVITWDKVYTEGRSLLLWPDEIVVSLLNKHREKLTKGLYLACGAGRHTILMAQMGIESVGVDSSDSAIKFAQKRSNAMGLRNIKFVNSLVQDIKFEKESFDIVIAWGLIHYLEKKDQEELLNKVKFMLKPNGIFLLTLRSTKDSRKNNGVKLEDNSYLVDYFDKDTKEVKQTKMFFWDENGVKSLLKDFSLVKLGHRMVEPVGLLNYKTAHWLVEAFK